MGGKGITATDVQVGTAVLNTGEKLPCNLCLVGVGARPNLDLFQGKLDLLEDKPGGVKVWSVPYSVDSSWGAYPLEWLLAGFWSPHPFKSGKA